MRLAAIASTERGSRIAWNDERINRSSMKAQTKHKNELAPTCTYGLSFHFRVALQSNSFTDLSLLFVGDNQRKELSRS
jgi:hypothetical protein